MAPDELNRVLAQLRWRASAVAQWCGYTRPCGVYWKTGRLAVPYAVAEWLRVRASGQFIEPPVRTGRWVNDE